MKVVTEVKTRKINTCFLTYIWTVNDILREKNLSLCDQYTNVVVTEIHEVSARKTLPLVHLGCLWTKNSQKLLDLVVYSCFFLQTNRVKSADKWENRQQVLPAHAHGQTVSFFCKILRTNWVKVKKAVYRTRHDALRSKSIRERYMKTVKWTRHPFGMREAQVVKVQPNSFVCKISGCQKAGNLSGTCRIQVSSCFAVSMVNYCSKSCSISSVVLGISRTPLHLTLMEWEVACCSVPSIWHHTC